MWNNNNLLLHGVPALGCRGPTTDAGIGMFNSAACRASPEEITTVNNGQHQLHHRHNLLRHWTLTLGPPQGQAASSPFLAVMWSDKSRLECGHPADWISLGDLQAG